MGNRLNGQVALVTGGASTPGLGSATAQRFAEEGAHVIVTDLDLDGAQAVVDGIKAAGGSAVAMKHDVTSADEWDSIFETIERDYDRFDTIVNNAGIAILRAFDVMTDAEWLRQNDVNLNSVFYGTQRAVKLMRKYGKGGSIINISSVGGIIGVEGCAAYAAAKGGVRIFSKTVALECARDKIRVNSVHPGMIMTNMQKVAVEDNPEIYEQISAAIPMGHFGEPVDIANMNLFLASDESRYCTGVEFIVDGGMITR
jgi:NAD(P)-dependent dehydrogenase (short-subunit alcohol dehydrogenase family)